MRTSLHISEIIDEWLSESDVQPNTARYYRRIISQWFRYRSQQKLDVRYSVRSQVIEYKRSLEKRHLTELSIDAYISVVKIFYSFCERKNYHENCAANIKSHRRVYQHRKSALTNEQVTTLLSSIDIETLKGLRDYIIISLMIFYGLRSCEVERIKIEDLSHDRTLSIQRKGRTEKSEQLRLSVEIVAHIMQYLSFRDITDDQSLFLSVSIRNKNEMLTRTSMSKMIKQRLRDVNIDDNKITCHSLRHTCAVLLINSGVSLEDIRDVLGHTDTSTTRIYAGLAQRAKLIENNPSISLEKGFFKGVK